VCADKFYRGIPNPQFLDANGFATSDMFQFEDTSREDLFDEASITWCDNDQSLSILMKQKKASRPEDYQFKVGVAVVERSHIDHLMKLPTGRCINYERRETDDNPYHGNLLRKKGIDKQIKTVIAASIAMGVSEVIFRDPQGE
jgi:hypothetical protein